MKVIIIGGSHAGIACARRTREEFPDAQVIIYEKQEQISFVSQSIPIYLMGKDDLLKNGGYATVESLNDEGIIVKTQTIIRKIDTAKKQIFFTQNKSNEVHSTSYDKLVLAVGSYPVLPNFSGSYRDKVYTVKNIADAKNIARLIEKAKKVVVVGAGFIGVEISQILAKRGLEVTLIQAHHYILNKYLDEVPARSIERMLEKEGVTLSLSTYPTNITEPNQPSLGSAITLFTNNDKVFEADAIIYSTGFQPNTFLLKGQAELGERGAIEVDEYMQTSVPDVFAIGDCATSTVYRLKGTHYLPHAAEALRQGEIAAINLAKPVLKLRPSQNTYNMNLDERSICSVGMTKASAEQNGYKCGIVNYRNTYLNSDKYINAYMVYEKETHQILGLQIEGTSPEIPSYSDLISLAIQYDLTAEDLEFSDFYFKHSYKNPGGIIRPLVKLIRKEDTQSH
ncbi:MAG: FAD-dependent oxidoreductase [Streptococcaceae bacterium]|nr:FAD-dependent oxidoreductase [Streptococcaceae bacterium]